MRKQQFLWLLLTAVACAYNAFEAPISFLFEPIPPLHKLLVNLIISAVIITDTVLSIRWEKKGIKEEQLLVGGKKVHRYVKSIWFPLEIFCAFPFDILIAGTGFGWIQLLKLTRISQIFKIFSHFKTAHVPRRYRVFLILIVIFIVVHLISCGWILLNPDKQLSPIDAYLKAIYWAITTLTTTGYGDITPTTNAGRLFTMGVMLTGFSAFGIVVGQVSNLIMSRNKKLEENRQKMEDLTMFLNFYEVPKELRAEAFGFYEHLLNKRLSDNDSKILADLPHALQHELQLYIKIKLISSLPVFGNLPPACLKKVAQALKQVFFSQGDLVIKKGDDGAEMFIIDHGGVEVIGPNGMAVAKLTDGQCFGEIALLTELKRTADVKATTYCDVFKFERPDYEMLAKEFPPLGENFQKIMKKRVADSKG